MSEKIPKKIVDRLVKHSEQYGISMDELKEEYMEYLGQVRKEFSDLPERKQKVLAYRRLKARLKAEEGGIGSRAVMHSAFFIGESGLQNTADQMIAKIKRMSTEEQRIFHPDPNTWLDYREGDTYLKPIEGYDHRTYYAVGSSGKEIDKSRLGFMAIQAWRKAATALSPELGVVYNFRAINNGGDKQLKYYDLNATEITRLRESSKQLTEDEKEYLIRNCGWEIYTLADLDMLYKTHFQANELNGNRVFDRQPVFIEADVSNIVFRDDRSTRVSLDDELETGDFVSTAYVPHYLPIKFKQGDRVIFLAELGEITSRTGDTSTVLFVKGYFRVPESSKAIDFLD